MYINSSPGNIIGKDLTLNSKAFSSSAGRSCSSSGSQPFRMVSCVSNYLQSLITDTAANKPQSAAHAGKHTTEERGEVLSVRQERKEKDGGKCLKQKMFGVEHYKKVWVRFRNSAHNSHNTVVRLVIKSCLLPNSSEYLSAWWPVVLKLLN